VTTQGNGERFREWKRLLDDFMDEPRRFETALPSLQDALYKSHALDQLMEVAQRLPSKLQESGPPNLSLNSTAVTAAVSRFLDTASLFSDFTERIDESQNQSVAEYDQYVR
jgi:hypothetical protein